MLNYVISQISKVVNRIDFDRYFRWFICKFDLIDKSKQLNINRINNLHPLRPRKGDIYLVEFGQNVGTELSNRHLAIIVQSSLKK